MHICRSLIGSLVLIVGTAGTSAFADENLFGYVKGAEPLPKEALELYGQFTQRSDKGTGTYRALDTAVELEYGATDRLAISGELLAMGIDTEGLTIDGYLPKDNSYALRLSGAEAKLKYNFLSPAKDVVGLSVLTSFKFTTLDPHSGQDKDAMTFEEKLLLQKYFLDGELILVGNIGLEVTRAVRAPIDDLPAGFDWPTEPEMEIGIDLAAGLTYRFAPSWFAGVEAWYAQENETEVGLERWSLQAGPVLHYGGQQWWATLTWLPQLRGGGEMYPDQPDPDLHLVEKTKQELRFKIGYNF
jgi:hypothetical protein